MNKLFVTLYENKLLVNVLCLLFAYIILKDLFKKKKRKTKKSKSKTNMYFLRIKQFHKKTAYSLYLFFRKIPVLKDIIYNLRMNILIQSAADEEDVALMVGQSIFFTIASFITSYILSLRYFNDIILSYISAMIITITLYNKRKNNKIKFLLALVDIVDDMVHYFNAEQGNLDDTFIRIMESENPLKKHFEKIFTCVKEADLSQNPEAVIQEYNKYAPSRYLRIICNYLYITYRYGDETINDESMFNKNMLAIQREVNNEAEKQLQVKSDTFGELIFVISPIYFLPMVKSYLLEYFTFEGFEYIEEFMHSNYGYMVMILCSILTLFFFHLYNKIMFYGDTLEERVFISWEENLLKKSRRLRKAVSIITPSQESKKYQRLKGLLIKSGSPEQISTFYFKKALLGISVCIFLIVFFTVQSFSNQYEILNNIYQGINENLFEQVLLVQDNPEVYKKNSIANDKKVIKALQNSKELLALDRKERENAVKDYVKKNNIDYGAYNNLAVDRILSKIELLSNKARYIEIFLFIALLTYCSYLIPNMTVHMKSYLNRELMLYDETMGLYTISILLVNHPSTNTRIILEWLTNFSSVFHSALRESLDNYSYESIRKMNKTIEYKPFNRLIESLLLSYNGVDIKKAFASIEQRQVFNEKAREMNNQKITRIKVSIIRGLSLVSLMTTLILYMLLPMVVSALDMFKNLNLI